MASRFGSWPAPPPVATGYSYPVMPNFAGGGQKFNRTRMVGVGGGLLALFVFVISLIAVLVRVIPVPCSRGCGPAGGLQLGTVQVYTSQKWGYSVPYDPSVFSVGGQDANGITLNSSDGNGSIQVSATSGNNVNGANQAALNALPSSQFQGLQQIGPVRGAEIGLVDGQGTAYSGQYVDSSGISATPIGLVIFSATQNGVTITVTAFSTASNDNADGPYGLSIGQMLDFPVTFATWKGQ